MVDWSHKLEKTTDNRNTFFTSTKEVQALVFNYQHRRL